MAETSTIQLPGNLDRATIVEIAAKHGARNVRLFGSRARGGAAPDSDLDLIVDFDRGRDLFDLVALKQELESRTGHRVDVVTERALSPYIRDSVLGQAVPL